MTIQIMNPPGLAVAQTHSQLAVASGSRTIYLAGQIGQDAQGRLVGVGDLAAQTEQALTNVGIALQAAGAGWADIAKMTIYVAGWKPERMGALAEGWGRVAARHGITEQRPVTLVGVEMLFSPEVLIEFDVTAVVG